MVGDRGMVSKNNIRHLEKKNYKYILGYRMRTIPQEDRHKVFSEKEFRKLKNVELQFKEATYNGKRLIVCYSEQRAEKDRLHREHILEKIKAKIKSGKLSAIVDNTHYKRFLQIRGEKPVIDTDKVKRDAIYDGMFVLTTNTNQSAVSVVEAYKDLWQVELAFRQLKSDLRIRPMHHYRSRRIEAHVLIAFVAYTIYKELERRLIKGQLPISPQRAIELTQTMYELRFELPDDPQVQHVLLKMDDEQQKLYDLLY
jgi:hypothetical protein